MLIPSKSPWKPVSVYHAVNTYVVMEMNRLCNQTLLLSLLCFEILGLPDICLASVLYLWDPLLFIIYQNQSLKKVNIVFKLLLK